MTNNSEAKATLSARVIRANGEVEDLGEIWNSNRTENNNINLEEDTNYGTSK